LDAHKLKCILIHPKIDPAFFMGYSATAVGRVVLLTEGAAARVESFLPNQPNPFFNATGAAGTRFSKAGGAACALFAALILIEEGN
jgi:hypothetical protein